MAPQAHDWHWLDQRASVSLTDLSRASGLTAQELAELVDYGAIAPLASEQEEPLFSAQCLVPLRAAVKLRVTYDLDIFTVVLLMDGLQRIEVLTHRIRTLESQVPHPHGGLPQAMPEPIDVTAEYRPT